MSKEVQAAEIDREMEEFVSDMIDTMHFHQGVGIAAPQVGRSIRAIVVNPSQERGDEIVLFNPVILDRKGSSTMEEGCLSVPGFQAMVKRAKWVVVAAKDINKRDLKIESEGFLARILQHEIDHIDGLLFFDRVSLLKRAKILKNFKRAVKKT